jgi:hypothetical protein
MRTKDANNQQNEKNAVRRQLSSVVSYPQRNNRWGDASYPGNCDGTLFRDLVLHYGAKRIADPMCGSGTTRDVARDLIDAGHRIRYWGADHRGDFDILSSPWPSREFDFVWIHPPYWNIVRYGTDGRDLSTVDDYREFIRLLAAALRRCVEHLSPGGRLAVLVGDVRRKGTYTPIVREVLNMEPQLGQLRSIIIKAQHNCRSDAKQYGRMEDVPVKHEYCVVFKK